MVQFFCLNILYQATVMDPGGIGALIGLSVLFGFGISRKLCDLWKQRREAKSRQPTVESPMNETTFRIVRQHSKINMVLPK